MTDYKYRVYDGATGNEFGDVARLSTALILVNGLRENYPQVTIDEIVPEVATVRTPQEGDWVRVRAEHAAGSPVGEGRLVEVDANDDLWPYRVIVDDTDQHGYWYRAVELV